VLRARGHGTNSAELVFSRSTLSVMTYSPFSAILPVFDDFSILLAG
jgi:hypothetical protein